MVYDSLIQAGVVVTADLGISFALFVVVGAERLFRREGSGSRLGHGEQLSSRFLGCRMRRLSNGLVGICISVLDFRKESRLSKANKKFQQLLFSTSSNLEIPKIALRRRWLGEE